MKISEQWKRQFISLKEFQRRECMAYFSKRVDDEIFANIAINVALFVTYKKGNVLQ